MTQQEFLHEVEIELGLAPGTIKPEHKFRETRYWDSLTEITLLATVEEKLGLYVTALELKGCQTIADLLVLAKDKFTE